MKENSIEEYIKSLEDFSNESVLYGSTVGMTLEKYKDLQLSTEHILSDYKRVLKENESWKSYSEELEEKNTEISNKKCELEFEVEKLQKENEELKSKNKTLEELLQGNLYELYKYYKELAGTYQENCILVQEVTDKIKILEKLQNEFLNNEELRIKIIAYKELLEGRK